MMRKKSLKHYLVYNLNNRRLKMDEYEVILDFSNEDATQEQKDQIIKAVQEGKKIKTTMTYFGDGDYNSFNLGEWFPTIVFNTNTAMFLGTDMGLTIDYSEPSEEDKAEIMKDIEENGYDDSYNTYLEESKDDFID
jgi:hypothetical protein